MWAKFDIIGFKYGEKNHDRRELRDQRDRSQRKGAVDAARTGGGAERAVSIPKRYVAATMGITLLAKTTPGEYTIAVKVTDAVGKQTYEAKQTFTVE